MALREKPVIADLRQRPEFFDTVVDRIWRAWWKSRGSPVEYIAGHFHESLSEGPIPFTLVAHDGATFVGTASVIASDLSERPQYSPWVAAVWVDPEYRERGVGAALVDRAARASFVLGVDRTYLCASRERRDFYARRGWTQIEEDVGEHRLAVLVRDADG